jgi:hypothetical protein
MPCLFALLAVAFPRVAIVLLFLFTNFFNHVFHGILIPVLGFLFLPLRLLLYTYLVNIHAPIENVQLVYLLIAVVIDLGLVGGGAFGRRGRVA